jgi:hypothetical protein
LDIGVCGVALNDLQECCNGWVLPWVLNIYRNVYNALLF